MTMTPREAFERGTQTFNAHDIDGFAEVLTDDVVFEAPGGMGGEGKAACVEFYGSWFTAFPDATQARKARDCCPALGGALPSKTLATRAVRRRAARTLLVAECGKYDSRVVTCPAS